MDMWLKDVELAVGRVRQTRSKLKKFLISTSITAIVLALIGYWLGLSVPLVVYGCLVVSLLHYIISIPGGHPLENHALEDDNLQCLVRGDKNGQALAGMVTLVIALCQEFFVDPLNLADLKADGRFTPGTYTCQYNTALLDLGNGVTLGFSDPRMIPYKALIAIRRGQGSVHLFDRDNPAEIARYLVVDCAVLPSRLLEITDDDIRATLWPDKYKDDFDEKAKRGLQRVKRDSVAPETGISLMPRLTGKSDAADAESQLDVDNSVSAS